jgi:hypothetical protein
LNKLNSISLSMDKTSEVALISTLLKSWRSTEPYLCQDLTKEALRLDSLVLDSSLLNLQYKQSGEFLVLTLFLRAMLKTTFTTSYISRTW